MQGVSLANGARMLGTEGLVVRVMQRRGGGYSEEGYRGRGLCGAEFTRALYSVIGN